MNHEPRMPRGLLASEMYPMASGMSGTPGQLEAAPPAPPPPAIGPLPPPPKVPPTPGLLPPVPAALVPAWPPVPGGIVAPVPIPPDANAPPDPVRAPVPVWPPVVARGDPPVPAPPVPGCVIPVPAAPPEPAPMFDPGDDADEQDGVAPANASAKPSAGIPATMSLEVNISPRIPHAEGV